MPRYNAYLTNGHYSQCKRYTKIELLFHCISQRFERVTALTREWKLEKLCRLLQFRETRVARTLLSACQQHQHSTEGADRSVRPTPSQAFKEQ